MSTANALSYRTKPQSNMSKLFGKIKDSLAQIKITAILECLRFPCLMPQCVSDVKRPSWPMKLT